MNVVAVRFPLQSHTTCRASWLSCQATHPRWTVSRKWWVLQSGMVLLHVGACSDLAVSDGALVDVQLEAERQRLGFSL